MWSSDSSSCFDRRYWSRKILAEGGERSKVSHILHVVIWRARSLFGDSLDSHASVEVKKVQTPDSVLRGISVEHQAESASTYM